MSSVTGSALDDPFKPIRKTLAIVRSSFLLSMVGLGILLVIVGSPVDDPIWTLIFGGPVIEGVLAGMFGIWGVSLIIPCSIGYAMIMLKKNN